MGPTSLYTLYEYALVTKLRSLLALCSDLVRQFEVIFEE